MDRSHTNNFIINSTIIDSQLTQARDIDGWAPAAIGADIWQSARSDADVALYRAKTHQAVTRLSELQQESAAVLAADPWQDHGYPERFLRELHWLLDGVELSAAEAAVLVLLPFLRAAHDQRVAAELAEVRPAELSPEPDTDADRARFESFVAGFAALRERARLRPEAAAPIGWWLFHRWLRHHDPAAEPSQVAELLELVGEPVQALDETFAADRMFLLLQGLRRGPGVCNPEFLGSFPSEDRLRAPGRQKLRGRQLALLAALAHGMAIELTALPDVVAEHLGIPHPVDPDDLRQTLTTVKWGGAPDLPVLTVRCGHEAVVEALREHTARLDELLHEVHRVEHPLVSKVPTRFSADRVEGAFAGYARFRHSGNGVRDLLMGVQLYKDPDLAIRELYQNALDACRYRAARTEYLDRTHPASYSYTGRIRFEQGVDEQGRHYVDCHDNGIGMGTAELRGVFCNATARFTDQDDYRHELARWQSLDPPVTLYPNSRFGIGVFSYFMLADEILVTTCRMGLDGTPGPVLEAAIHGPGHLFRIEQRAECGAEPGTRVRLYLRAPEQWSCVGVLRRLLGIAEFETSAEDMDRCETWQPGQLHPRRRSSLEFGLNAHGTLMPWAGAPPGFQVIWCEHGGGLLVDGLVVQSAARRLPFMTLAPAEFTGVVVNLFGPAAPRELSADRTMVQDDLSGVVGRVLTAAVEPLVAMDGPLPHYGWLCEMAKADVALADQLTLATAKAGRRLFADPFTVDLSRAGCFPNDWHILNSFSAGRAHQVPAWATSKTDRTPDHVLLWRLLANGVERALRVLLPLEPALSDITVCVAQPSDDKLLTVPERRRWLEHWGELSDAAIISFARQMSVTPAEVIARAHKLGVRHLFTDTGTPRPAQVQDLLLAQESWQVNVIEVARQWRARGIDVPEAVVRSAANGADSWFLKPDPENEHFWLDPSSVVPAGHLALASRKSGRAVSDVRAHLEQLSFRVDSVDLPEYPQAEIVRLLSTRVDGRAPWLVRAEPVPPGHILRSSAGLDMPLATVLNQLERFGFEVPALPADATADEEALLVEAPSGAAYKISDPIPWQYLVDSAETLGITTSRALARLRAYGFTITPAPPARFSQLDWDLFGPDGPLAYSDVNGSLPITFVNIIEAALELRTSTEKIVRRASRWGFQLSATELPEGLDLELARQLLDCRADDDGHFSSAIDTSLQGLLHDALRLNVSIDQLVCWWRGLGIEVPDPRTALRAALARVPRA